MKGKQEDRPIPLVDLQAQFAAIEGDIRAALDRVLHSQHFILGPEVEGLERELAGYCGARHAVGVSSGTDAILISLMALGIGPGDEVITTPYTFFASAGAIVRLGARPVFVDIERNTYNIDPTGIEARVTERTKAIMPVHLFGRCADMSAIRNIASAHKVPVIEDAAQAIGATSGGRHAGSMGELGCFSFFPSKTLGAFGDGGMVVTSDDGLAEAMRILRTHGAKTKYLHDTIGGNFRLDALQAAVLRAKLPRLDAWIADRRRIAARYRALFAEAELPEKCLEIPEEVAGHTYTYYVIRAPRRDHLAVYLKRNGIGCAVYYPLSLHQQPCFADLGYKEGDMPVSEAAAKESLALPIYPEMTDDHVRQVVDAVSRFLRDQKHHDFA